MLYAVSFQHRKRTLAHLQGSGHRIPQPLEVVLRRLELVHHQFHKMGFVSVQACDILQHLHFSVYAHLGESTPLEIVEHLFVVALASHHQWGQQIAFLACIAVQEQRNDLLVCVPDHGFASYRRVGCGCPGVEKTQEVVYFCDGAYSGPRIVACGLLLYGNDGAESAYALDFGLFHYAHEMPCIGAESVHIAPLPLCKKGVKGQGTLAATRQTGDYHELTPWYRERYILEVVAGSTCDNYFVLAFVHA